MFGFSFVLGFVDYILDFFGFKKYPVVNYDVSPEPEPETEPEPEPEQIKNVKEGVITSIRSEFGVINGVLPFKLKMPDYELEVGDVVSFNYRNSGLATDVTLLSHGCNEETKKMKTSIIGKISDRQERIFIVEPDNYKFDLDQVYIEFLPYIGDWVRLVFEDTGDNMDDIDDAKEEKIERVLPLRTKTMTGVVTQVEDDYGTINNRIYFTAFNCPPEYQPSVKDQVIYSAIESHQGSCDWRAIMIKQIKCRMMDRKLKPSHRNLTPKSKYVDVSCCELVKLFLDEEKTFKVFLKNNFRDQILLKTVINPEGAVQLINDDEHSLILKTGIVTEFEFKAQGRDLGFSEYQIQWFFADNTVSKTIRLEVVLNCNLEWQNMSDNFRNNLLSSEDLMPLMDTVVIPGGRHFKPKSFIPVRLPDYSLPPDLEDEYRKNKDKDLLEQMAAIQSYVSNLQYDLQPHNYKAKFHSLIFLEEIALKDKVAKLYLVVKLTKAKNHIIAHTNGMENLNSLCQGDLVYVSPPWSKDYNFEGSIRHISGKTLILSFSELFMRQCVDGKNYGLSFKPSRSNFRRKHQAVDVCWKHLGQEWLFPARLSLKGPQITVRGEQFNQTVEDIKECIDSQFESKMDLHYVRNEKTGVVVPKPRVEISLKATINWINPLLNIEQRQCIKRILEGVARPLPYIIFGPPGTGKTCTLIELIIQVMVLMPDSRLLVAAPTNSAVDLIAQNLVDCAFVKSDLIRLAGYNYASQGRLPVSLVDVSAIPTFDEHSSGQVGEYGIKMMGKDLIGRHRITLGTTVHISMLYNMGFSKGHFTHIIIDESGQATEPEIMIPLGFLDKLDGQVIIAGDPMQLGPVVLSRIAESYGLGQSFLNRMFNRFPYTQDPIQFVNTCGFDPRLVTKLIRNYRALPKIVELYSDLFYNSSLIPQVSAKCSREFETLCSAKELFMSEDGMLFPIIFHAVNGTEALMSRDTSFFNKHEAMQVVFYVIKLYNLGIKMEQIGIISPYAAQVKIITEICPVFKIECPKVGSVEEFQGQERDFIIITTVRSIVDRNLKFISNPNRFNVSVSRAKSGLIVIGKPDVLLHIHEWKQLISICRTNKTCVGSAISPGFV